MRVSTTSTYLSMTRGLGGALERVAAVQDRLATGKQVSRWSDDAPAAASASRYRAEEADHASYSKVARDAKGWLSTADGTLQSMSTLLTRAKELAVNAGNGALSATSREATARELEELRDHLADLGNARHLGRPLFGGFQDQALHVDGGTVSWAGDDGQVRRQVSPTVQLSVNVQGGSLFGFDSGTDVFSVLQGLADAARSGSATLLGQGQQDLEAAHGRVLQGLSQVGSTTNRVDAALDAGEIATVELAALRSRLEEIDIAEAVLTLSSAQAGYQAALGAAAKSNLPSLADFLR